MLVAPAKASDKANQVTATRWPRHALAALLYLVLTLLLTWPLALNLTQVVPGNHDLDADQNIWNLWWFKTALLDRQINPFYTDLLHYPYWNKGLSLVFHSFQPLNGLLALPVTALFGPLAAFNFVVIFAFTATAFNTYLLALYLFKDWNIALVVGALFGFAPLHFGYFQLSSMETLSLEWIPLYILFLHLWTERGLQFSVFSRQSSVQVQSSEKPGLFKRVGRGNLAPTDSVLSPQSWLHQPTRRGAVLSPQSFLQSSIVNRQSSIYLLLAALFLLANALTDWYFTLYMLIYTALLFLWQIIRWRREWRTVLVHFILLGLVSALLAAPLLWLVWQALRVGQDLALQRDVQEQISWSAAPWSFLVPGKTTDFQPPQWGLYFFGYVALALAGCALLKRRSGTGWWWLVAGIFLVLALGPYLKLNDSPRSTETTGIPLPYLLLRQLPLVSISRIVGRFYLVADLAIVILAGYGLLNLKEWFSQRKFSLGFNLKRFELALVGLLLCAWLLEVQTLPVSLYKPEFYPFYTSYLQNNLDRRAILELPIPKNNEYSADRMVNQIYSNRPMLSGYLSRSVKDNYRTEASPFRLVLTQTELNAPPLVTPDFVATPQQLSLKDLVAYYNFGHIVLFRQQYVADQFAATVKAYQSFAGGPVYQDNQITAFKAPSSVALDGPRLYAGDYWYQPETLADGTVYRWAKNGNGYAGLLAPQAGSGKLAFQGWAFGDERDVAILLNGVEKGRLRFSPAPQPYQIELNWQAGENVLEFKSVGPGKAPGNGDNRNLTFAIGNLALR